METIKKCMVATCFVVNNGKVLMIDHKGLGVWLPPGGHLDEGEFPEEAAVREVLEETGVAVELVSASEGRFSDPHATSAVHPLSILIENINYATGVKHRHYDTVYLAVKKSGELRYDEREAGGIGWFGPGQLDRVKTYPNVRELGKEAIKRLAVLHGKGYEG
ncbi:MAG: NUDIX domain-containing protein [Candidatus Marsarchaeota archaeon]|jgi:8-oxo-dGTP pyrophosphatase MutT (NUDIX family)|nr:NUDIX domain-containing protein [Candidatus Marsarchaeota archaeon]